jgi:hypothetical protein
LRYHRAGDTDDEPWNQSESNQVRINKLDLNGNSYWVVHRLTFPAIDEPIYGRVSFALGNETDIILNRLLIEGAPNGFNNVYTGIELNCCYVKRITVQNSVIRGSWGKLGTEPHGISLVDGEDIHVVNNELYNWSAHAIQVGRNQIPTMPGFVVENNDIYADSSMYLPDGRGRHKSPMSTKASATADKPGRIIHNRAWGGRNQNAQTANIVASVGMGISVLGRPDGINPNYILIQNNIIYENQLGHGFYDAPCEHCSIIGNIYYKHAQYYADGRSHAIEGLDKLKNTEIYLNSFINNSDFGFSFVGDLKDIRCNVFLFGGAREGETPWSTTQADYNAFYDTPSWTFNGTNTNIDKGVSTRANSVPYTVGSVVRWADPKNCSGPSDAACYLYMAKNTGQSFGSQPEPCTTLGCTFDDGTVKWQAIRGPYTFYRKLRTKPEPYTIPYARIYANAADPTSSAPEARLCPMNYAARIGMGINDGN